MHLWVCFARSAGLSEEYVLARVAAMVRTLATPKSIHLPPTQGVLDILPAINDERFENIENEEG